MENTYSQSSFITQLLCCVNNLKDNLREQCLGVEVIRLLRGGKPLPIRNDAPASSSLLDAPDKNPHFSFRCRRHWINPCGCQLGQKKSTTTTTIAATPA